MVRLSINGNQVMATEGQTVLEAARAAGIYIPTLCHNDALKPYGSCRLCIVEIKHNDRTSIESSCTYPVAEGLEIQTESPRVIAGRRIVIELLLNRCPNVKVIRQLAQKYSVTAPPAAWRIENEYCILCGLCVRACHEVVGAAAIEFVGRGIGRSVDAPFHLVAENCVGCGACAFVCPTGIIKKHDLEQSVVFGPNGRDVRGPIREISNWQVEHDLKLCLSCGNPIAPLPLLKKIADDYGYQMNIFNYCPSCRTYPEIDKNLCTACNGCIVVCPAGAAQFVEDGEDQKSHIFTQYCCGCLSCIDVCGWGAVKINSTKKQMRC